MLTPEEAAEYLGVTEKELLNSLQISGIIRGVVVQGELLFPCDRVERAAEVMKDPSQRNKMHPL